MEAHRSHREEAGDLSRSLRWSTEQLEADHAAKLLLAAEEGLVAAHTAALAATPAAVAIEQRALDKMNATCEMEVRMLHTPDHVPHPHPPLQPSCVRWRCAWGSEL